MEMLIPGLISGGASLLSSFFGSETSAKNTEAQIQAQERMQAQTMQFNAQQAEAQRQWQTQMSNTAYTRAQADMKAAGLNPILAAGGAGASTPSGSTASVGTPTVPMPQNTNPLAGLGDAVAKAVSTAIGVKTYDKMTEEVANLRAQEARTKAETEVAKVQVPRIGAETERTKAETGLTGQRTETEKQETYKRELEGNILGLQMPGHRVSAREAEDIERMPDWLRSAIVQGAYTGKKADAALSPLSSLVHGARDVHRMLNFNERWPY